MEFLLVSLLLSGIVNISSNMKKIFLENGWIIEEVNLIVAEIV